MSGRGSVLLVPVLLVFSMLFTVPALAQSTQAQTAVQLLATSGGPVNSVTVVAQASQAIKMGNKVNVYTGLETYLPQQQLKILQDNLKRIPPALPVFISVVPPVIGQNASALPTLIQKATKLSGTYVVIDPVPGHEFIGAYSTNAEVNQLIAAVIKAQGQKTPVQSLQSVVGSISAVSPVPAASAVMKASTVFRSGTKLFVYQTGLTTLIPAKDMQYVQGKLTRKIYLAVLPPVTGQNASALPTLIQKATSLSGLYVVIIPVPGHEFIGAYSTDPAIESLITAKLHGNVSQDLNELSSLLGHNSAQQGNSPTGVTILGKHTGLAIGALVGIAIGAVLIIICFFWLPIHVIRKRRRIRRQTS